MLLLNDFRFAKNINKLYHNKFCIKWDIDAFIFTILNWRFFCHNSSKGTKIQILLKNEGADFKLKIIKETWKFFYQITFGLYDPRIGKIIFNLWNIPFHPPLMLVPEKSLLIAIRVVLHV